MKNYLVFQVGCIECGVSSYVISTEESLQEAKEVADKHPSTWTSEGGDGMWECMILHLKRKFTQNNS